MRRHNLYTFVKGIFLMQLFLLILIAGVTYNINISSLSKLNLSVLLLPISRVKIDENMASKLMLQSSTALAAATEDNYSWWDYIYRRIPESMMASNLHVLASRGAVPYDEMVNQPEPVTEPTRPEDNHKTGKYAQVLKNHSVVFYCTHSAETYIPDSGTAKLEGERGLVNQVAQTLAGLLSEAGATTEYIDTIHDSPSYDQSYARSRATVKSVLESKKGLLALFDIHRDSILGQKVGETITINGKPSARILIIVGTDQRKPHPHWRENLAFAQKISATGEKMYPGLIKGIKPQAGTYNQEFFPHALLLEFGSDRNSFSEAQYAAELFSEILLEVLSEEVKT